MEELEGSSRGIHAGLSGNGEDKQRKHMLLIQPAEALNETPSMSRNLAHEVIYAALPEAYDVLLNRRRIGASRQNQ